jgi:hypothetical protein
MSGTKISTPFRTLTPAYGRDYTSAAKASTDFFAGKDFKLQPEDQYCAIFDFEPGTQVVLRYNKLRNTTTVTTK